MKSFSCWSYKHLFGAVSFVLLMTFALAACGPFGGSSGNGTTAIATGSNATATGSSTTATATPVLVVVRLGAQPCPDAVKDPAHWMAIIAPTQGSKVESVTCANLTGTPTLQAVVTVRSNGTGALLDVYVYSHITDPNPNQLFKLLSLYKGDAKISGYNTLMTAEVDQNSLINKGKDNASLTQDLFREFKWSDGAGTLVPVGFPGIFPDLTRYQAEADQAQVNQGHQPWKLSATMTAQALVANQNLLKWDPNSPATIVSGGGNQDLNAVVNVKNPKPAGGTITVTMSRLEGNTNGGIWEATSVTAAGMSITTPKDRDRLSSPTTVTGTGNAFEGIIGRVIVLDHLYTNIGQAGANGATGNGNTTFSASVTYNSSFKTGIQEGLVVLYSFSNADSSIAGAVMVKEMLS